MPPSLRRIRARVSGHVQGVGFRYFAWSAGRNLDLAGFVRNEADGTVVLEAEGPAAAIDDLLRQVRRGPAHARVDDVAVEDLAPRAAGGGFELAR
jgi:acylphosphatase